MTFRIGKRFSFDAAHQLAGLAPGHKCARMHGHTYTVEVILTGETLVGPGFVTDFGDLTPFGAYLSSEVDHRVLNEVVPVEPTSELLAQYFAGWILDHLAQTLNGRVERVRVSETPSSWAEYRVGSP